MSDWIIEKILILDQALRIIIFPGGIKNNELNGTTKSADLWKKKTCHNNVKC